MSRARLCCVAAAAALSCLAPRVAATASLHATGSAAAGAYRDSDSGGSSLLPGPDSLQVTVGAAASDAAGEFSMEAIFDGIGVARYGSLVGSAHAEASSQPASSFTAGGEILIDVGFTDGAEVVSDTLAEGTPVTLTFRMTLDASAMHFTDGKGLNPPDTGAAARHEVEVRDLDDVTVPFGQGALVVNSIGDNERLRTFEFDTAVGHRIELEAHLFLGAGVTVDHPLYAFTQGAADVLAGNTAELFHEPSGDVRLVADSGHDYAVPEPGRGVLLALSAALLRLRGGAPGRRGSRGVARLRSPTATAKEDRALAHPTVRLRARRTPLAAVALAACLGLAAQAPAAPPAPAAEEDVVDGIAAQVGSDIVLVSEVRNLVRPVEEKMKAAGAPESEITALRSDALERLIERAMIRQVVRRAELEATDVEIDQAISNIAAENGLTLEQLAKTVESEGLPYPIYRERIRGEIEQSKVINGMVASKVRVDDAEVRAAYHEEFEDQPSGGQEVRLRHLLVPYTSDAPEARNSACAAAERARARIAEGERFEVVVSQLEGAAPGSGDIGWMHEDRLAGWMNPAVRNAAEGGVTSVIETEFGCNVLQVVQRRPYEPRSYEQAREHVYQRLFQERMQREYLKFMDKLREQTYVERKGIFAQARETGGMFGSTPGEDPSGF